MLAGIFSEMLQGYRVALADHYVFAEDHGTECRDTVRTVEEEALFLAAYPDIVDQFLKEREEAQENKLKRMFLVLSALTPSGVFASTIKPP